MKGGTGSFSEPVTDADLFFYFFFGKKTSKIGIRDAAVVIFYQERLTFPRLKTLFQKDPPSSSRSNKMDVVCLSPSMRAKEKVIIHLTGHIPNPAKSTFVFAVVLVTVSTCWMYSKCRTGQSFMCFNCKYNYPDQL